MLLKFSVIAFVFMISVYANNPQVPPKITRPASGVQKSRSKQGVSLSNNKLKQVNQIPLDNKSFVVKGARFTMVGVQGGSFKMGSVHSLSDAKLVHDVKLSSFYIGQTEVTQSLWEAVMDYNPSYNKGSNLPVEDVNWNDCQEFIRKLNRITGEKFRLPTEAEWEFAARGGNKSKGYKYSGSNDIEAVAWYRDNSDQKSHPVGTKQYNELGIYDMSGNVSEWCNDWYGAYRNTEQINPTGPAKGNYKICRSSSWMDNESYTCVWVRCHSQQNTEVSHLGFRLAL